MRLIGAGTPVLRHYGYSEDGGVQPGDIRFFATDPGPGWRPLGRDMTSWEVTRLGGYAYVIQKIVRAGGEWLIPGPGAGTIYSSTDLSAWVGRVAGSGGMGLIGAAYGVERYVLIGANHTNIVVGTTLASLAAYAAPYNWCHSIKFGLNKFFLGCSSGRIATSATCLSGSWTVVAIPGVNADIVDFAFGPGNTVVAVGGDQIIISTDGGGSWSVSSINLFTTNGAAIKGVACGNAAWVLVGARGLAARSTNLVTWVQATTGLTADDTIVGVAFEKDLFALASYQPAQLRTSTTGEVWLPRKLDSGTRVITSIASADGRFATSGGSTPSPYNGEIATWNASIPLDKTPYIRTS